ncbi:MAG: hypothetical protein HY558_02790 [Euryarchaeota archaeon]|nr:hypothetical protein [Euryarchaeota archaeon]
MASPTPTDILKEARKRLAGLEAEVQTQATRKETEKTQQRFERLEKEQIAPLREQAVALKMTLQVAGGRLEALEARFQKAAEALEAVSRELSRSQAVHRESLEVARRGLEQSLERMAKVMEERVDDLEALVEEGRARGQVETAGLRTELKELAQKISETVDARLAEVAAGLEEARRLGTQYAPRETVDLLGPRLEGLGTSLDELAKRVGTVEAAARSFAGEKRLLLAYRSAVGKVLGEIDAVPRKEMEDLQKKMEARLSHVGELEEVIQKYIEESAEKIAGVSREVERLRDINPEEFRFLKEKLATVEATPKVPPDLLQRMEKQERAIADLTRRVTGEKDMLAAYRTSLANTLKEIGAIKREDLDSLRHLMEERSSGFAQFETRLAQVNQQVEELRKLEARLGDMDAAARKTAGEFEKRLASIGKLEADFEKMKAGIVKELSKVNLAGARTEEVASKVELLEKAAETQAGLVIGLREELGETRQEFERRTGETLGRDVGELKKALHQTHLDLLHEIEELKGGVEATAQSGTQGLAALQGEVKAELARVAERAQEMAPRLDALERAKPAALADRVAEMDSTLRELQRKVGGEKDLMGAYRNAIQNLVKDVGTLRKEEFESFRKSLEERAARLPELEVKVEELTRTLSDLAPRAERAAALEEKLAEMEDALASTRGLSEELEDLRRQTAARPAGDPRLAERLLLLEEGLARREKESPLLQDRLTELQARIGVLDKIRDLPKELSPRLDSVEDDLRSLEKKMQVDRKAMETLQEELHESVTQQVQEALQGLDSLKKKDVEGLRKALEERMVRLPQVEGRIESLGGELAQLSKSLKETPLALEGRFAGERKKLDDTLEEFRKSLRKETRGDLQRIEQRIAEMSGLSPDLQRRLDTVATLDESLKALRAQVQKLAPAVEETEVVAATVKGLKAQVQRATAQADTLPLLEKAVEELRERFQKEEKRVAAEVEKALRGLTDELGSLKKGDLEAFRRNLQGVAVKLPEMEAQVTEALARFETHAQKHARDIAALARRTEALESEGAKARIDELQRKKQALQATIETLRTGYEEELIPKDEYEAIAREHQKKIEELDRLITALGG